MGSRFSEWNRFWIVDDRLPVNLYLGVEFTDDELFHMPRQLVLDMRMGRALPGDLIKYLDNAREQRRCNGERAVVCFLALQAKAVNHA